MSALMWDGISRAAENFQCEIQRRKCEAIVETSYDNSCGDSKTRGLCRCALLKMVPRGRPGAPRRERKSAALQSLSIDLLMFLVVAKHIKILHGVL